MKKCYILLLLVFSCTSAKLSAQVVINEIASAGDTSYLDEDGKVQDWIELYNAGATSVNLKDYQLTCAQNNNTYTWTFPEVYLNPQQRLTVYCSGKDRNWYFNHWEVPVYYAFPWRYFEGHSEPPPTWTDPSFNDALWNVAVGSFGYGDNDDSTIISSDTSLYLRYSFNVADTSKVLVGALLGDFDDGFVAYLNGVEISRMNIGVPSVRPAYNEMAYDEHEATLYQYGNYSAFSFVTPELMDQAIRPGINTFAIQIHNQPNGMDDLSAFPNFIIGITDTSQTYFPLAADVRLHTDFKLNSHGCTVALKNNLGQTLDQQVVGEMQMNDSRGRQPDGGAFGCLFDGPSPDSSNNFSACYSGYGPSPTWSLASGFYTGTPQTSAAASAAGTIHWSMGGNDPDLSSSVYTSAISLTSNSVLRARLYPNDPSLLPGPDATATYFINENVTVPVVSLVTDPDNLFNIDYGIYVMGHTTDTTFADIPFTNANFWQGWKRPANITFFDQQHQQGFQTPASISIQGNWSKLFAQRGFYIDADEDYGGGPVNYQLFPDKAASTYYGFNLRNGGTDWNNCMMRDRLVQKTAQAATSLDVMDGYTCVLFINGTYWGVYELREKQDKHYIKNNSGVDDENIDFLQFNGDIIEGDNQDFLNMATYIGNSDMTQALNYDSAKVMIDLPNFCDYFITETYVSNTDWLGSYTNNIKFWRQEQPVGKWRYVLWDTDLSLGANNGPTYDMLDNAINPPVNNPHSDMLRSMLANTEFKNYFVNRYADLMNTAYLPDNFLANTLQLHQVMAPEMTRHFALWGTQSSPYAPLAVQWPCDSTQWISNLNNMLIFTYQRLPNARNQIQQQFNLAQQVDLTLDVFPAGAGTIHLNTITPDSLPWTGVYFDGVPVTMTVQANPGYRFKYWQANTVIATNDPNPSLTVNVDNNSTFTAVFEPVSLGFTAYPNPFFDGLNLTYTLPADAQVSIRIYNALGQIVGEPVSASTFQTSGTHTLNIDPDAYGLAGGVYFFEMRSGDFRQVLPVVAGRPKN